MRHIDDEIRQALHTAVKEAEPPRQIWERIAQASVSAKPKKTRTRKVWIHAATAAIVCILLSIPVTATAPLNWNGINLTYSSQDAEKKGSMDSGSIFEKRLATASRVVELEEAPKVFPFPLSRPAGPYIPERSIGLVQAETIDPLAARQQGVFFNSNERYSFWDIYNDRGNKIYVSQQLAYNAVEAESIRNGRMNVTTMFGPGLKKVELEENVVGFLAEPGGSGKKLYVMLEKPEGLFSLNFYGVASQKKLVDLAKSYVKPR